MKRIFVIVLIWFMSSGCAGMDTKVVTQTATMQGTIAPTDQIVLLEPTTTATTPARVKPTSQTPTPIVTPTREPTITATSTIAATPTPTPTTESPCVDHLERVQEISPNWSAIIEQVNKLEGYFSLTISADGQYFAVLEADSDKPGQGYIHLWEVNTGQLLWSVASKERISIAGIAFSPDGTLLATGATDTEPFVFVWDVASGEIVHKLSYAGLTTKLSFSSDNKYLAIGGLYPSNAAVWNLEEESVTSLNNGNGAVFVPTSTEPILVVYKIWRKQNESSPIYLLNLSSDEETYLFSGANSVDGAAISSDGNFVSTVNFEDGNITLKVFDLLEEKDILFDEINLEFVRVNQIDFSSAGHIGVLQGELNIWDSSGRHLSCLDNPTVNGFVFTPDGSHLLTYSGYKAPLTMWELLTP